MSKFSINLSLKTFSFPGKHQSPKLVPADLHSDKKIASSSPNLHRLHESVDQEWITEEQFFFYKLHCVICVVGVQCARKPRAGV